MSWNQARTFAQWMGGDLLSEAQWEYVATSQGQSMTYPWGNTIPTCQLANYSGCLGGTAPVCSRTSGNTIQGVCDMAGNLWEWVLDEYHNSYVGAPNNEQAWCNDIACNTNLSARCTDRGASWSSFDILDLRSISRSDYTPNGHFELGFRVAIQIP